MDGRMKLGEDQAKKNKRIRTPTGAPELIRLSANSCCAGLSKPLNLQQSEASLNSFWSLFSQQVVRA